MGSINETYKSRRPMPDVIDLLEDRSHLLTRQVAKSGGNLLVLVHPFYQTSNYAGRAHVDRYFDAREDLFDARLAASHPVVVFEEASKIAKLAKRIGRRGTVFTVQTKPASPDPKQHSWKRVAEKLKSAGVRKIELGGAYLGFEGRDVDKVGWIGENEDTTFTERLSEIRKGYDSISSDHPEWLVDGLLPTFCVGGAGVQLLKSGIDVDFSPASLVM